MPSKKKTSSKKKGKAKKQTSSQEFLENSKHHESFLEATKTLNMADNLIESMSRLSTECGGMDGLESYEASPSNVAKVASLPQGQGIWCVDIQRDEGFEQTILETSVTLIDKTRDKETNAKTKSASYIIGTCLQKYAKKVGDEESAAGFLDECELVLCTVVKSCLQPHEPFGHAMPGNKSDQVCMRPKKLILPSVGIIGHLQGKLREMKIKNVEAADSNIKSLIREQKSLIERNRRYGENYLGSEGTDPNDKEALGLAMGQATLHASKIYVSEDPVPLRGWEPPTDCPTDWVICPPDNPYSFRLSALWGWRTNLQRAIIHTDKEKVVEITKAHDADEVREFCEIRSFLCNMAGNGYLTSCQLLLDYCHVSIHGNADPSHPKRWREFMKGSGAAPYNESPLMKAAMRGHRRLVIYLLERGASIDMQDSRLATALHVATALGHLDVMKVLCKRGANLKIKDSNGQDPYCVSAQYKDRGKVFQEKAEQILLEYDMRCSYCRADPAPKLRECPCHKERYCDVNCQRKRWKDHRKYHNQVIEMQKAVQESESDAL